MRRRGEPMRREIHLLTQLYEAWTVPGPVPTLHERKKERVRREMPVLAAALDRMARERGDQR